MVRLSASIAAPAANHERPCRPGSNSAKSAVVAGGATPCTSARCHTMSATSASASVSASADKDGGGDGSTAPVSTSS